ncbi:hypothetical protein MUK70_18915 [Dyadobacter chenwenxiniae]|uniref:Uncharacterized protein n=1 Tax=Dyadobacter chenwenxiniae TaxID=2906456 RepID=A0A9X1TE44_9BACT|nr:hypothetical protein [Dyadobacter chenwenxiniae]MCF0061314.1 hypothetical protein [Dyadobacter chenwenxiniae]UON81136.1 hypothetical protein MUK70_18915 [Dyadobacter chenwenxiniae]
MVSLVAYPYSYNSMYSGILELFVWEGEYVAILSRQSDLDQVAVNKMLKAFDSAYLFYLDRTGKKPLTSEHVNQKLPIADVPFTCDNPYAAACGHIGAFGIELRHDTFDALYMGVITKDEVDQTVFYELGRNFWFYDEQYDGDPVARGFAIFMRFVAMEFLDVKGAVINGHSFEQFKSAIEGLAAMYIATDYLYWENLVAENRRVPNDFNLDQNDLFASFCFELHRRYPQFINNVWKETQLLKKALSTQDVIDNFFLASCNATRTNLTVTFENWRWKISDVALAQVSYYMAEE